MPCPVVIEREGEQEKGEGGGVAAEVVSFCAIPLEEAGVGGLGFLRTVQWERAV